jgi:CcmD family protein
MSPSEKYTAAAYLVVFVGVLLYVLIIASKLQRLERKVTEIVDELRDRLPELAEAEAEAEREREPELHRG